MLVVALLLQGRALELELAALDAAVLALEEDAASFLLVGKTNAAEMVDIRAPVGFKLGDEIQLVFYHTRGGAYRRQMDVHMRRAYTRFTR